MQTFATRPEPIRTPRVVDRPAAKPATILPLPLQSTDQKKTKRIGTKSDRQLVCISMALIVALADLLIATVICPTTVIVAGWIGFRQLEAGQLGLMMMLAITPFVVVVSWMVCRPLYRHLINND